MLRETITRETVLLVCVLKHIQSGRDVVVGNTHIAWTKFLDSSIPCMQVSFLLASYKPLISGVDMQRTCFCNEAETSVFCFFLPLGFYTHLLYEQQQQTSNIGRGGYLTACGAVCSMRNVVLPTPQFELARQIRVEILPKVL